MSKPFSIVVHGWTEGIDTPWVNDTISSLIQHRGGCIFFMDYSKYAKGSRYLDLLSHFDGLLSLLTRKFQQIGNYDQQFCYGFSFGARLCINAGINVDGAIGRMDLCEPTGVGFGPICFFWPNPKTQDPKLASNNTQCINTSTDKGTSNYDCHQNFRMGQCGSWQPAAGPFPLGSHGLCPYFYNYAFDHKFVPNNYFKCKSGNEAEELTNVQMGYLGHDNRQSVRGEIFIATAKYPPYVVVNDTIDNVALTPAEIRENYEHVWRK